MESEVVLKEEPSGFVVGQPFARREAVRGLVAVRSGLGLRW